MPLASDQQTATHGRGNITSTYTAEGRAARQAGHLATDCPHPANSLEARLWGYGWGSENQVMAQLTAAGAKARSAGATLKNNPYRLGTTWCAYWAAGWRG